MRWRKKIHKCIHCGKRFQHPFIDRASFYCPHCKFYYPDEEYEKRLKKR